MVEINYLFSLFGIQSTKLRTLEVEQSRLIENLKRRKEGNWARPPRAGPCHPHIWGQQRHRALPFSPPQPRLQALATAAARIYAATARFSAAALLCHPLPRQVAVVAGFP